AKDILAHPAENRPQRAGRQMRHPDRVVCPEPPMSKPASPQLLQMSATPVSVDPPHLVLQREFARRQAGAGQVVRPAIAPRVASLPSATNAGVYSIRNRVTGRVYVSGDLDVDVALDFDRFALKNKQHRNAALQSDWDWFGEQSFSFNVFARIE